MLDRRQLLGSLGAPAAAIAAAPVLRASRLAPVLERIAGTEGTPEEVARNEDYWREIQTAFTVDRSLVNLNNGGVSPAPRFAQDAVKRHLDFSNNIPAYSMWRVLDPQLEGVRRRLAREWKVDSEEIAMTRNASEGLQTCQFGIDLAPGDEVVATDQDYPRMLNTFRQRERREGIVLRTFPIPTPAEDPAEIVRLYEEHLTDRTRIILVSHMINLTGQILPVKEIVALGRSRGIPVIVDGAHALAHFDFTLAELDCDYYASSLHKWLFAPIGTGLLYVRRDRIAGLWPLMAATEAQTDDIRKFEQIGTHSSAAHLAVAEALTFSQGIGAKRKEARLKYLRDRWAQRLLASGRVRLNTSLAPGLACGIANVHVDGVSTSELQTHLWKNHKIYTIAIKHRDADGLRVSPSVYTTLEEIDRFTEAVEDVMENGLPE